MTTHPRPTPRHLREDPQSEQRVAEAVVPVHPAPPPPVGDADGRATAPSALRTLLGAMTMAYRADRRTFSAAAVLQLIAALAPVLVVIVGQRLLQAITDAPSDRPRLSAVALPVIALAAVTAVTLVASTVQHLQQRILGEKVAAYVWNRVLDVSTRVRLESYESPRFYDQLQRLKEVAFIEPVTVTNSVFQLVGSVIGVIGLVVVLFTINAFLAPLLLLAGIPSVLLARYVSRMEFAFVAATATFFRAREYLRDTLTGRDEAKEIRVFDAARALRRRHDARTADYQDALRGHVRRRQRFAVGDVVLTSALLAVTLGYIVLLVSHGTLGLAQAAAAILAVRFTSTSLSELFAAVGELFESAVFLDDLDDFITRQPALEPTLRVDEQLPALSQSIVLSQVGFRYPGGSRQVLHNIDLHIGANEIVALVGENGSGKTTLAKVVAGLYRPGAGELRWDGVDLATVPSAALRHHVSAIFQDFVKYELTALDNIGLGDPDHAEDEAAARRVAEQARAAEFLDRLPLAMGTILSKEYDGGQDLSQGQWQRVALARALRKDSASLIILDEPTASLDPRAEAQLYSDIRHTLGGRAALLISHRFSSVRLADRIYVLRDGRIIEVGTHESLVAEQGVYAELFRIQAQAYR